MYRGNNLSRSREERAAALRLVLFVSICLSIVGCGGGGPRLAATPNVLRDGSGSQLLADAPVQNRKVEIPIIYVTDREKYSQNGTWPLYGSGRSATVAYGTASVGLKPMPTWDELVKAAGSPEGEKWEMSVFDLKEVGSVLLSPDSLEVRDGAVHFKKEVQAALDLEKDGFHKLLEDQLAGTPKKDVYFYVHGVANYFESPVLRSATLWHFMGRQGAFVAYSWPAGKGGLLGYFYDRESGEFTVLHLKRILKLIASTPGVERLHIICHSRGGDITTTALRELNVEYAARGESAQKALKLQTLVLAAPDLDAEVFSTRLMFEGMATISKQIVVYCSEKDKAVGLADKLFHSKARLGTLSQESVKPAGKRLLAELPWIQIVQCNVSGFGTSHDYIFTNPGALSDLIMVLRDGRKPGAENGRPLTHLGGAFWSLDNNYMKPAPPVASAEAK
jgi:esterase/lipase superfamily enzyme